MSGGGGSVSNVITGATDNTEIGNTGNSLNAAITSIPALINTTVTGSLTALNTTVVAASLNGFGTAGILITGTWVGTISFEGSVDNTTFVSIPVTALANGFLVLSTNTNGSFRAELPGLKSIRVKMTSYTSGTASITIELTPFVNRTPTEISGKDNLSTSRNVQTKVRGDGLIALVTDATVTVESTFGTVDRPFSFFTIIKTGAAGDTITVSIAATFTDVTTPDADVPAYSKIFTIVAGEVGDEPTLTKRIITELNSDATFRTAAFLKATRATDRNVVIIRSDKFSQSGEFYERPLAGDFSVVTTGTSQVVVGFDNLVSRSIPVVINPDIDSGHRLGRFGISGAVTVSATQLSDFYTAKALNGGSPDLRVNGSVTPVDFLINAGATQLFIEHLFFYAQGNGIQFGRFISQNQPITNGVLVTIKSDNILTTFPLIKSTEDFKNEWAALSGDGANFRIDVQSGRDEMLAILSLPNPFILRESGAFGAGNDDFIKVKIQDNLSANISSFKFRVKGFEKEP